MSEPLDSAIATVEAKIQQVELQLEARVGELANATDKGTIEHLRQEVQALRKEKEQLREEKLVLLRSGLTAGLGGGSAEAGGPSARNVLASPLPLATTEVWQVSGSARSDFKQPKKLRLWERANPEEKDGPALGLDDAIVQHQETFAFEPQPRLRLPEQTSRRLNSEADVAGHLQAEVCRAVLEKLAPSLRLPRTLLHAQWSQQPPAAITRCMQDVRESLAEEERTMSSAAVAAAAAAAYARPDSGWDSTRRKADLVLEVILLSAEEQQPAAASSLTPALAAAAGEGTAGPLPAAKRRKIASIGEVKRIARLIEEGGTAVDLLKAYTENKHCFHHQAQEVVGQIYTYLLTWRICHGFVSCWNATWLVYVPPGRRALMYVSRPFLATAGSGAERRATMLGALSWQQLQALLFACKDRPAASLPSPAAGTAAAGGGEGGSGSAGDRAWPDSHDGSSGCGTEEATDYSDPTYEPSSGESLTSSRALLRREAVTSEPSGSMLDAAATTALARAMPASGVGLPASVQPVRLRYQDLLAEGGDGTVFTGTYNGDPAVIKVFTWEARAQAAYWREVEAYRALAPLQGSTVPRLLSHGKTETNLRYIALMPVEGGRRLSDCARPFSRAVARAARRALRDVQAACAGFVHGDLALDNMLLVQGAAGAGALVEAEEASDAVSGPDGDGGGAPRCVLLDFARSRLDADGQQRQREWVQLQQLLGRADSR